MAISKDDFEKYDWQRLIAAAEVNKYEAYHTIFQKRAEEAYDAGDDVGVDVFSLLQRLVSMWLDPSSKDAPLQPLMVFDNGRTIVPDDFTDEQLDILSGFVSGVSDAEMRARIADVLWLRKHGGHHVAILAIESYLESSQILEDSKYWVVEVVKRVERAIRISLQLNQQDLFDRCIAYIESLLKRCETEKNTPSFTLDHLMKLLLKFRRGDSHKYAEWAREAAISAEAAKNWYLARLYWETKSEWHSLERNESERETTLLSVAETYVEEAEAAAASIPSRYMAACMFLEEAIEALRRIGGQQERIDELHETLLEYGKLTLGEMQEVEFEVNVTKYVNKAREVVKGKTLYDALFTFATLEASPSVDQFRQEVEGLVRDHPIQFLVPVRTRNKMGKVTARGTTIDEDVEVAIRNEMLRAAVRYQSAFGFAVVQPARQQIILEHHIRVDDLLPFMSNN